MKALEGIRVLDCTHFIAGPFCSQTLADHGADVLKIEPINGEPSRKANPMYEDFSVYFASMNRNKRGLAVDMKSKQGKKIMHKLIKTADILVTNYSVGVPEKLGIDYKTISKINPKIIMVHITGFGLTGEKKDHSAFDGIVQAMSGIAHLTGERKGDPMKAGLFIADHIAGFHGVIGALLALQARNISGKGHLVDIAMLDSMVSMLAYNLSLVSMFKKNPHRAGNRSTNVFATTFPSNDGHVYIAPLTEQMWIDLCKLMGKLEWTKEGSKFATMNGRLKHYDELEKEISSWTRTMSTEILVKTLNQARIACGKVNSIEDLFGEKQLLERQMLLDLNVESLDLNVTVPGVVVKMSDDQDHTNERPPLLGEHTIDILQEVGYEQSEIQALKDANIINIHNLNRRESY